VQSVFPPYHGSRSADVAVIQDRLDAKAAIAHFG
jgi:hypothetical protein